MEVVSFDSAATHLDFGRSDLPGYLVLAMEPPCNNGLDLQRRFADQPSPPIIFISDVHVANGSALE
jgi:FixJ family two-component response regulator